MSRLSNSVTKAFPRDWLSPGVNPAKAMSTRPACFQIGRAASAATSTPWTATTTFFSTNWLAQFTDDSGVMSRLQVSAFIGRPLMPPSSSFT